MEEQVDKMQEILNQMVEINKKVNLFDEVWNIINSYDENYAKEQGIDLLDNEDVYNIVAEILQDNEIQGIIKDNIESYAGYNKSNNIQERK